MVVIKPGSDIIKINFTEYLRKFFFEVRGYNKYQLNKTYGKLYFKLSDPTTIQFEVNCDRRTDVVKVLVLKNIVEAIDVINFFLEISDAYAEHHSDYYPEWMRKPRTAVVRGLIKDALGMGRNDEFQHNGIEYEDLDKMNYKVRFSTIHNAHIYDICAGLKLNPIDDELYMWRKRRINGFIIGDLEYEDANNQGKIVNYIV